MKRFFSTVLAASALLLAVSSHAAEYEFMFSTSTGYVPASGRLPPVAQC